MKLLLLAFLLYLGGRTNVIGQQSRTRSTTTQEKINQLTELSAKNPLIVLNYNKFKEYVRATPRDYSFIVMFTALSPTRSCGICQHVFEEFTILANSFKFSPAFTDKLYFGVVDFDDAPEVFQMLHLNTAPMIMHFPAKGKPKPSDNMDLERTGVHAEALAKWVQDRTDIQIRIFRPPNYSAAFAIIVVLFVLCALLYAKRNSLQFLYNTQLWAIISIFFCFTMISGQMWNQIRGPPFIQRSKDGPIYISGGSHGQLIVESYIIMILYAAIVSGVIMMIEASGGVQDPSSNATKHQPMLDIKKKQVQAVVGLVIICVFFSFLLSVFKAKTHGYPYSFLFK